MNTNEDYHKRMQPVSIYQSENAVYLTSILKLPKEDNNSLAIEKAIVEALDKTLSPQAYAERQKQAQEFLLKSQDKFQQDAKKMAKEQNRTKPKPDVEQDTAEYHINKKQDKLKERKEQKLEPKSAIDQHRINVAKVQAKKQLQPQLIFPDPKSLTRNEPKVHIKSNEAGVANRSYFTEVKHSPIDDNAYDSADKNQLLFPVAPQPQVLLKTTAANEVTKYSPVGYNNKIEAHLLATATNDEIKFPKTELLVPPQKQALKIAFEISLNPKENPTNAIKDEAQLKEVLNEEDEEEDDLLEPMRLKSDILLTEYKKLYGKKPQPLAPYKKYLDKIKAVMGNLGLLFCTLVLMVGTVYILIKTGDENYYV